MRNNYSVNDVMAFMSRIGKDVADLQPQKTFTRHYKFGEEWEEKILDAIVKAPRPVTIKEIMMLVGIGNYQSTKDFLINLEAKGKIEHFRVGHIYQFQVRKSQSASTSEEV